MLTVIDPPARLSGQVVPDPAAALDPEAGGGEQVGAGGLGGAAGLEGQKPKGAPETHPGQVCICCLPAPCWGVQRETL